MNFLFNRENNENSETKEDENESIKPNSLDLLKKAGFRIPISFDSKKIKVKR